MSDQELPLVHEIQRRLAHGQWELTRLPDQTGVVLDLEGLSILSCNRAAMVLLDAIASGCSKKSELVGALSAEFAVDEDTAEKDLLDFLSDLRRHLARKR